MTTAMNILIILLCVYAAVLGTSIGVHLWAWFWSDDE